MSGVALRRTSVGWEFASEAALEKFIWENLQSLLGFTPLKRQHISNGEICDLLAFDKDRGLIVIELKNAEDRYLIQQLTRYYANLLAEKPFQSEIDYTRAIRLISIAPTYHRHNLIDRQYSNLNFELLQFSVIQEDESFYLCLQELERETVQKYPIPYQAIEFSTVENIPEPPELLLKWLAVCTKEEQQGFLRIRSTLLACSQRMREIINRNSIQYGSGKTQLCAEICFQQKSQKSVLFLWLPTPSTYWRARAEDGRKPMIGRLRIWTDGQTISHVGHVPEGFGKMRLESEWKQLPPDKRPKGMRWSLSSKSHTPVEIEGYLRCAKDEEKPDFWDVLANLAGEEWLERL